MIQFSFRFSIKKVLTAVLIMFTVFKGWLIRSSPPFKIKIVVVILWRPAGYWNLDIHVLTDVQTG